MRQAEAGIVQKNVETEKQQEQYFQYICGEEQFSYIKRGFAVLIILMTVFFVLTGTYSCRSMGDIAVLLSWIFYLVPLLLSWNGLLHLLRQRETVSTKERKKGLERLQQSGGVAALIAGVSVFACGYFLVTGEYESVVVELGMIIRNLAEFLSALGLTFLGRYSLSKMRELPKEENTENEL